jgi:hypothetical protein
MDHKQRARAPLLLLPVDAVQSGNCPMRARIGEEREAQPDSLRKGVMAPDMVGGDPEQAGAQALKLDKIVLIECQLLLRYPFPIEGIEYQDNVLRGKLMKRHAGAQGVA